MACCFRWAVVLGLILPASSVFAAEYFIAPTGNDANPGTAEQPWATLERAKDAIRARRRTGELKNEKVVVWLRGGDYELTAPFTLTAEDSGTPQYPVEFSAYGAESPRVIGGRRISNWSKLPAAASASLPGNVREKVFAANLRAHGVPEFPSLTPRNRDLPLAPGPLAVLVQGRPAALARWPNQGWAQARRVGAAHFHVDGAPPVNSSADLFVHAFWSADDCDRWDRAEVVRERIQLRVAGDAPRLREGARVTLHGCPELLDEPGEWVLKSEDGLLLFWPPHDCDLAKDVFVSVLETPISLYGVSHFTLNGIRIEGARVMGVEIAGGECVKLNRCVVSSVGNVGVHVYHGRGHEVTDCEIAYCGSDGVRVEGGSRETLQPCGIAICNNEIHNFGRLDRSFHPGIHVAGVGVRVAHNEIHSGPHGGVHLVGNDHVVEFNDIHHVCTETEDCGAIYLGSDPTYRGNVIQHNLIRHLGGFSRLDVVGVYLDDFASGTTVLGNAFQRAGRGVAVGGGRDNVIENNLFVDCVAAVQVDSRGITWARTWLQNTNSRLHKSFALLDVDSEEVKSRYGNLREFFTDSPGRAKNNRVVRNAIFGEIGVELHDGLTAIDVQLDANVHDIHRPSMVDEHEDLRRSRRLPELANGFEVLPLERMGRTKAPSATQALVHRPAAGLNDRNRD